MNENTKLKQVNTVEDFIDTYLIPKKRLEKRQSFIERAYEDIRSYGHAIIVAHNCCFGDTVFFDPGIGVMSGEEWRLRYVNTEKGRGDAAGKTNESNVHRQGGGLHRDANGNEDRSCLAAGKDRQLFKKED